MATSNFHSVNANNIYVIDFGNDDISWSEAQDIIGDNIKYALEQIQKDSKYITFTKDDSMSSQEELRSYPSSSIGTFEVYDDFIGVDILIQVNIFLRSGYYEAANLDYEVSITSGNDDYDDIRDFDREDYVDYLGLSNSVWNLHSENFYNKVETIKDEIIEVVEKCLCNVSEAYEVSAQFSNGETFYSKCVC